jgi:flagellar protein FlbT
MRPFTAGSETPARQPVALRLSLKPKERVIIGGAVVRNGDSRTELLIENEVPVLREPNILSPGAVRTPCERIYLALQLVYVDPGQRSAHLGLFRALVADVLEAAPSCSTLLISIEELVAAGRFYQALKAARQLMKHERNLMTHVH